MGKENPQIKSGSNSINFGDGNSVTNSSLHIGDVYNQGQSSEPTAFIDRTVLRPIGLAGQQLHAVWLTVSGIIGFIGSIVSIASFWKDLSPFVIPLLVASGVLFVAGIVLTKQRFLRLPPFSYNLEADRQGRVFITRIEGQCPKCDGTLKLRDLGPKEHKETFVRCIRNPDHIWRFDFTVLGEPKA